MTSLKSIAFETALPRPVPGALSEYHQRLNNLTVRPKIVCLCGSTRFGDEYAKAALYETLAGHIVLTIGCNLQSDAELFADFEPYDRKLLKSNLDILHLFKIQYADEVLVLNKGGYIGESTAREIVFAKGLDKPIRYLEPDLIPSDEYLAEFDYERQETTG